MKHMNIYTKLWIGIGILALLSPVGIYVPQLFHADSAWGEWDVDTLSSRVGYIPSKMHALSQWWKAVMPDYAFSSGENSSAIATSLAYIFSACIGVVVCIVFFWIMRKYRGKK